MVMTMTLIYDDDSKDIDYDEGDDTQALSNVHKLHDSGWTAPYL